MPQGVLTFTLALFPSMESRSALIRTGPSGTYCTSGTETSMGALAEALVPSDSGAAVAVPFPSPRMLMLAPGELVMLMADASPPEEGVAQPDRPTRATRANHRNGC